MSAPVDEFELAHRAPAGGAEPRRARPGRRRRSRPAPWLAAAGVLIVVGGIAATPVPLIAGRGEGPDFGLTDLDLGQPPTLVWETSMASGWVAYARGDRAIVTTQDTGTTRLLVGIDLSDGTKVWRYDDASSSCQMGSPLVCVQDPGTADAQIVTITLDDGARSSSPHPLAYGAIAVGDGSTVVVEKTETEEEDVVLLDADGEERWHQSADATDTSGDTAWTWLRIADDALWLGQSQLRVDLATGTESDSWVRWVTEDGTFVTSEGDDLTITTADGEATISQTETLASVDDDLGGPVRLTSDEDGQLTAAIRNSEQELWRLGRAPCIPEARVSGVVVVSCWDQIDSATLGIDELTGEVLWETEAIDPTELATADTLVFATVAVDKLLGIDPSTGVARWEAPLSGSRTGYWATRLVSDGLLVMTSDSLLRFAWD